MRTVSYFCPILSILPILCSTREFFGGEDVEDLKKKIKDLETRLFLEELNNNPAHRNQQGPTHSESHPFKLCVCNPDNGGNVCKCSSENSVVDHPTKTSSVSSNSTDYVLNQEIVSNTTSSYPERANISYTVTVI